MSEYLSTGRSLQEFIDDCAKQGNLKDDARQLVEEISELRAREELASKIIAAIGPEPAAKNLADRIEALETRLNRQLEANLLAMHRIEELEALLLEHLEPPEIVGLFAVTAWHDDYLDRCRKALEGSDG